MLRVLFVLTASAQSFAAPTQPQQCLFSGASLRNHSGARVECSRFAGRQVALYFAGEWCPLCRHTAAESNLTVAQTPLRLVVTATHATHGCSEVSRLRCGTSIKSLPTRPKLCSSRPTSLPRLRELISTTLKATGLPSIGTIRSPRRSSSATACGAAWRLARSELGGVRACRPSSSWTRRERRWRFYRPNGRVPAHLPDFLAAGGAGPRSCDEANDTLDASASFILLGSRQHSRRRSKHRRRSCYCNIITACIVQSEGLTRGTRSVK